MIDRGERMATFRKLDWRSYLQRLSEYAVCSNGFIGKGQADNEPRLYRFPSDNRSGAYGGTGTQGYSPIIREFPGMIPPELTTMPLDKEIEFVIVVVLGTVPISKAPYRMAPLLEQMR